MGVSMGEQMNCGVRGCEERVVGGFQAIGTCLPWTATESCPHRGLAGAKSMKRRCATDNAVPAAFLVWIGMVRPTATTDRSRL